MKTSAMKQERFLTDANGKCTGVVLNLEAYQRLLEAEEELADIHAYDSALPKVALDLKAGHYAILEQYRTGRNRKSK
jgi:hypothetical protein